VSKKQKNLKIMTSDIGLFGLAVMGQNLALNIAEKGFSISVHNRSTDKVDATVARAIKEGNGKFNLSGYHDMESFIKSLKKPRRVILLVQAGPAVDATIEKMMKYLEKDDAIIDGGNEVSCFFFKKCSFI
jgi:6-phosphogluconate dehydrogenase